MSAMPNIEEISMANSGNPLKKKTILILGAGIMQRPAIEIAKAEGWRVCVVDGNENAPYRSLADHFHQADLKFPSEVIEVAKKWDSQFGLDGVFTAGTDFSLTVAKTAKALGLPSLSVESARMATDKGLMREAFWRCGVSIPRFFVFQKDPQKSVEDQIQQEKKYFPAYPVVVKPVDNMGARGIIRCDTEEALFKAIEKALGFSRSQRVIIEEYIEGDEFSVDAIVENGKVTVCGFAKRHIFFPPYFIEMGHTMPADDSPELISLMIEEFKKGVLALQIENGAAKGDIKLEQKEGHSPRAVIGEIAARLSGGYMSGWTYPYASGIQPTLHAMRIALGEKGAIPKPSLNLVCAERAFISMPGEVETVDLPNREDFPAVRDLFVRVQKGSLVGFPTNNVEKCGNVLAVGSHREEIVQIADDFVRKIIVRLNPFHRSTEDWMLNGHSSTICPLQFDPSPIKNIQKDEAKCFIFSRKLPKIKRRGGDLSFFIPFKLPELSGVDWHGRNFSQVCQELTDRQLLVLGKGKLNPDWVLVAVIPLETWLTLLTRGSVQGACWLVDRLTAEWREGRFDFINKLGGEKCEGF